MKMNDWQLQAMNGFHKYIEWNKLDTHKLYHKIPIT